jgi:hypothetical protein
MRENRLQYQLLNKNSVQRKSINTKIGLRDKVNFLQQKQLSSPIIQESEETLRNLTSSEGGEKAKNGGIVKPKIYKFKKPKLGISTLKNFIKCK